MNVITEIELLQRIDTFLERHDMAPTTFGRKVNGEQQLIESIRRGRSPSLKLTNKIVDYMAKVDREAEFKLTPPPPPGETAEEQLPFGEAPVNRTGASSPTCSTTAERPPQSAANGSCPCSTHRPAAGQGQTASCSMADDPPPTGES